jgi:hypothetical protein
MNPLPVTVIVEPATGSPTEKPNARSADGDTTVGENTIGDELASRYPGLPVKVAVTECAPAPTSVVEHEAVPPVTAMSVHPLIALVPSTKVTDPVLDRGEIVAT